MKNPGENTAVPTLLQVVAELMRGGRHSRRTIADTTGRSLATADRWIEHILEILPNAKKSREGKTTWVMCDGGRERPSKLAVVGACVAASLASMFEGTGHERNLKDARDHLLRLRGETYSDLDRKFVFAPRGGEYALPEAAASLDEIIDALLSGHRLAFSYRHNDGRDEALAVEPLSLVLFDHQFYVLVRRQDRSLYCYRFARMSEVDATEESFVYPSKNEYDPLNVLEPSFGVHISGSGPVEDVAVILQGTWAKFVTTHRWHPTQQVESREDGSVTVTLRVRLCPELETWVLGFGENAVVLRPQKLRDSIATRLAKAGAPYSPTSANHPTIKKTKQLSASGKASHRRTR